MPGIERNSLLDLADEEEIFLPVARRIMRELGPNVLTAEQHDKLSRREALRAELAESMLEVGEFFDKRGLSISFIKGFSTERAYGEDYHRQFDDLDAAVADLKTFWDAAEMLLEVDYIPLSLVLAQDPVTGKVSGVASLGRPSHSGVEKFAEIEIQIGALPLHWHSCLSWDRAFWDEQQKLDGPTPVRIPSNRYNLLVLIAETVERTKLRLRDYLDMQMLLGLADENVVEWLRAELARNRLELEVNRFSRRMNRISRSLQLPQHTLPYFGDIARRAILPGPRPLTRAFFHDLPLARKQYSLPAAVKVAAASVFWDGIKSCIERRTLLKPLRYLGQRVNAQKRLKQGWYVQFLPLGHQSRTEMTWHGEPPLEILLTPIGSFLAIPVPAIHPDDFSAALDCVAALE